MADDILASISQLSALSEQVHLFCPRYGDDDNDLYYDEDLQGQLDSESPSEKVKRQAKIAETDERTQMMFKCLQILAFDGDAAEAPRELVTKRINMRLRSCDVCIRRYHRLKPELRHALESTYDVSEVLEFLKRLDQFDIDRISNGLDNACRHLESLDPSRRSPQSVPFSLLCAFIDALSCAAFLVREDLLEKHLDLPFQLIQTKKRLRSNDLLPAMFFFLFSHATSRYEWAAWNLSKYKREIQAYDFDGNIKDPLLAAMGRVQRYNLDAPFLPKFWDGAKLIVSKLTKDVVTHSLKALDLDLCKLTLEHMSINFAGYPDLLASFEHLLRVAPNDVWDSFQAMGAISPATVSDQIFNNPAFQRAVETSAATEDADAKIPRVTDLFGWIKYFAASVQPINRVTFCRSVCDQLLAKYQEPRYPLHARSHALKVGVELLENLLSQLLKVDSTTSFVGFTTVREMLGVVDAYRAPLLQQVENRAPDNDSGDLRKLCFQVLQKSISLDCVSLSIRRRQIDKGELPQEKVGFCRSLWEQLVRGVRDGNISLATYLFQGVRALVSVEPFNYDGSEKANVRTAKTEFDTALSDMLALICEALERLGNFNLPTLEVAFRGRITASAILTTLILPHDNTRQEAMELVKRFTEQTGRKEALRSLLIMYLSNVLSSLASVTRAVTGGRTNTPAVALLKILSDISDVLCDSQDGLLRAMTVSPDSATAAEEFWEATWAFLTMVFQCTEGWSDAGHEKSRLIEFCRDTMEFADQLFDQFPIFKTAVEKGRQRGPDDTTDRGGDLLQRSNLTMSSMVKWLRLRDEFLNSKIVSLITKLITRLHASDIKISEDVVKYILDIIHGKTKSKLSTHHLARLRRALEEAKYVQEAPQIKEERKGSAKQASISSWLGGESRSGSSTPTEGIKKLVGDVATGAPAYKQMQAARKAAAPTPVRAPPAVDQAAMSDFRKKRMAELEAKKQRDRAAALRARSQVGNAGSGLRGLDVQVKDHSTKKSEMMVASDEESESEDDEDGDDMDAALFGSTAARAAAVSLKPKGKPLAELPNMPVKKKRLARSARDMRARLAPDLTELHQTILKWDYFSSGVHPPNVNPDQYSAVANQFTNPFDYRRTFEPLLILEAWQGFIKSREEETPKPFGMKIANRTTVDSFIEVAVAMSADDKNTRVSEADILLLSKSSSPVDAEGEPHCLARVSKVRRKAGGLEVLLKAVPNNPLSSALVPNGTVFAVKVQSMTTLEREFGALVGLAHYDLCDEIVRAKPSPLLSYTEAQTESFARTYTLNKAQSKAVKFAIDNDGFTLIQGPPGTGKTKTIVAIVGALLTNVLRDGEQATKILRPMANNNQADRPPIKKLLVCAPSNAAVDELVMRLREGVKTTAGQHRKINVVRLGRPEAINPQVLDVTLEELVTRKMQASTKDSPESRKSVGELAAQHKKFSEEFQHTRLLIDSTEAGSDKMAELKRQLEHLGEQKRNLSRMIDDARDMESRSARDRDLNRRRMQQQVLEESHVLCATLSSSGHDMFQSLEIEFETVIIDEAAQCVEMSALIPLKYGCNKCILVGDPKQLPPTVLSRQAAAFQYEQSLFVRMQKNHPKDVHLLDTQYRMHSSISKFPSKAFYDGRLLDGPDMDKLRVRPWHANKLLAPYRFFDVRGKHSTGRGHSLRNIAEVDAAVDIFESVRTMCPDFPFQGQIGIITPYKAQLAELKSRFSHVYGAAILDYIDFNTTDAFQGRESDIIIFSCVRSAASSGIGFLQDVRRMNVGLTRAKSSLWVLGNTETLVKGEFWRMLIEDARAREAYAPAGAVQQLRSQVVPSGARPAPLLLTAPSSATATQQPPPVVLRNGGSSPMDVDSDSSSARPPSTTSRSTSGTDAKSKPNGHGAPPALKRKRSEPSDSDREGVSTAAPPKRVASGVGGVARGPAAPSLSVGSTGGRVIARPPPVGVAPKHEGGVGLSPPVKKEGAAGAPPIKEEGGAGSPPVKKEGAAGSSAGTRPQTTAPTPGHPRPRPPMVPPKRKKADPFLKPNRPKKG